MCSRVSSILHDLGALASDLSVYSVLGQGEYGTVLGVCKANGTRSAKMALKVTVDSPDSRWEIEMQQRFHAIGLAPDIHDISHSEGKSFILMKHIDMTLEDYLLEKKVSSTELVSIFNDIEDSVDVMYNNNLSHGDMHVGNIAVVLDNNGRYKGISYIDFGFSTVRDESRVCTRSSVITREVQVLREYLQLLRTSSFLGDLADEVRRIVMQRLNRPDMVQIRKLFQAGDDLENNEATQDETFELVQDFFAKNAVSES